MTDVGYRIKIPVFEGPLDLLLHLIKENEIDIYDIPIAEITKQYLEYLELMKELNLEIAGEFLVMAATLIQIKTRMLLPVDEDVPPEEREDPRIELVEKLLEYQAFKNASLDLQERLQERSRQFWREPLEIEDSGPDEPFLFDVHIYDLIAAFKRVLENAPPEMVQVTRETLTVKDRINYIIETLEDKSPVRFEELFEPGASRQILIVTFLALLEVLRFGIARAYQERDFGIIWIIKEEDGEEEG
ncbi:MAG: segregation/condensation protein A [Nitrospirae bacterium]|nr:MAG: segregation/condensation protein A [Nitrospirota bacterium]